ncbi:MAG: sulfotransferase family protein [Candidatus Heimdallarchaeaceae archaeon]
MAHKKTWLICKEEPLAGMSFTNIFKLLLENKFRIHPKYYLRFWYAMGLATITAPMRIIERILYHRKIKKTEIKTDPVFVIGHYRTGTTYLMTLLAMDKDRGYVSNLEGYAPHFFLSFPKITKTLIDMSLPDIRPMDNVPMGAEEPTEEEYSIGAMSKYGYYNGFIFPRNFDQYTRYLNFEGLPKDLEKWKKVYYYFVQKMTLKYEGRQMIFKNPTNNYRIPHILEMFPNAKFIHTYRNPYEVYPSTYKFFEEVFAIYTLQTWDDEKMKLDILRNYKSLYEHLERDIKLIPKGNIVHLKYEEFIEEPMKHIDRIYSELGLELKEEYRENMRKYAETQKREYKPNKHRITDDVIERVNKYWSDYRDHWGYEKLEPSTK